MVDKGNEMVTLLSDCLLDLAEIDSLLPSEREPIDIVVVQLRHIEESFTKFTVADDEGGAGGADARQNRFVRCCSGSGDKGELVGTVFALDSDQRFQHGHTFQQQRRKA